MFTKLPEIVVLHSFLNSPALTVKFPPTVSVDPSFGFQADYMAMVFLRGGIGNVQNELQFDNSKEVTLQPSFGVGFRYRVIQIDYALTNIASIGNALYSNIFSVKLDFDEFR